MLINDQHFRTFKEVQSQHFCLNHLIFLTLHFVQAVVKIIPLKVNTTEQKQLLAFWRRFFLKSLEFVKIYVRNIFFS